MLTVEENKDYWKMISDFSNEHEDTAIPHEIIHQEDEQFKYILERQEKLFKR